MNKDEIIRMNDDEEIIIIRGYKAFKCKKLRYWKYRLGKNIDETTVEEYKPNVKYNMKPIIDEDIQEELPTFEEFLKGRRKIS